jgi:RNA polymerase sigma-70 factor (ECF subfamily)
MVDRREQPEIEQLLERIGRGDVDARGRLWERFRDGLKGVAAANLDPRMAARVDPSDVAQEALAEADRRLGGYLRERPLPFYPWLVQFARDCLIDAKRKHLGAAARTVLRENEAPEGSAFGALASDTGPVDRAIRGEKRDQVRTALDQLTESDRTVLMLRHTEGLSTGECAAALGLTEEAVKSRHRRALERLRELLEGTHEGSAG